MRSTRAWRKAAAGAAAAALLATGCSQGDADDAPSNAGGDSVEALATTLDVSGIEPAEPVLTLDDTEVEPPPPSLERVVANGAASGDWTLAEGTTEALRWAAGEVDNDDLAALVSDHGELTGLLRHAQDAIADPDTPDDLRAELHRLLDVLAPSPAALDAVSQPAETYQAAADTEAAETEAAPRDTVVAAATGVRAAPSPAPMLAQDAGPGTTPGTEYSFACSGLAADGLDVAELTTGDDPCYLWIERTVEAARLRVYYPLEWSEDDTLEGTAHGMLDALDISTQVYADYGEVGDVNLAISQLTEATWPEAHQVTWQDACQITVFPSAAARGPEAIGQTVAHEVFHCVQDGNFETEPYDSHKWWMEGSADFYSNVVYPTTNDEHLRIADFNTNSLDQSIFEMSYENTVFFQHLANLYGTHGLWDLLQEVTPGGASAAQAAMAARGDMDEVFHDFVIFFITGSIADTGGGVLDPGTPVGKSLTEISEADDYDFETRPFVATRYGVRYDSERAFTQSTSLDGQGRGSSAEQPVRDIPQEWGGLPDTIRTRCDEPAKWPLVVTSVQDDATFTIEVSEVERGICDGCVLGYWDLDVDTFEQSMIARLGAPPELGVEGSGFVDFADDGTWTGERNLSFTGEFGAAAFGMDAPTAGDYEADGEMISMPDENGRLVPAPYTCDLRELVVDAPDFGTIRYVRPPVEDDDDDRVPPEAEPPPVVTPVE